ncbi:MAG: paraquat-inducible protein A [Sulfurovum sp.]|nr:paraquat-inducible protein A [Sulfurovum sp.]
MIAHPKRNIYALISLCLLVMLFLGAKAYVYAIEYEQATTNMVMLQGAGEQAKLQLEKLAKVLLGESFEGTREVDYALLKAKQEALMQEAQGYTLYFMYVLAIVLGSFFFISLRAYTFFGSITAMITLFYGLISPLLMVTIHKEVEYLGDIVLSFESKGVIGSIEKLFSTGDIVVATVILLFSVIVPILKILSLFFIAIFVKHRFAGHIVAFFKAIGKWSMVDVFVVAVFLVYLTANKADVSRAEVEVGLYFFLAYVLVSMLVSVSASKMLQRLKDT